MHKLLALSTITGCFFLMMSITSIVYENNHKDTEINFVYETYDSSTINRLYSQKKIFDEKNNSKQKNNFIVSLKKKPLNPDIIDFINKKPNSSNLNLNINEIDLTSFLI